MLCITARRATWREAPEDLADPFARLERLDPSFGGCARAQLL